MQYANIIAEEAKSLPPEKQAEVLDFIEFLKTKINRIQTDVVPKTPEEIDALFSGFNIDLTGYKFDRDEANAR
jgi:Protein of unknown function (DUF2281)